MLPHVLAVDVAGVLRVVPVNHVLSVVQVLLLRVSPETGGAHMYNA